MYGEWTMIGSKLYATAQHYVRNARQSFGIGRSQGYGIPTFNVSPQPGKSFTDVFVDRLKEAAGDESLRNEYNRAPYPHIAGGFNLGLRLEQMGFTLKDSAKVVLGFPDTTMFKPSSGHQVWIRFGNYVAECKHPIIALEEMAMDQGMVFASTGKGISLPNELYMRRYGAFRAIIESEQKRMEM